jgi:hypothetical protein
MISRSISFLILTILMTGITAPSLAATGEDFYRGLLRRGIAHVEAGQHDAAAKLLRIAAFGLVDSIDEFETAHVYLTIAHDGMKREAEARASALRVLTAERIARRYASLSLPPAVRARFEAVAAKVLNPEQMVALRGGAPPPAAPPPMTIVRRDTSKPPAATNGPGTTTPATVPQPSSPAPVQVAAPTPAPTPPRAPAPTPVAPQPVAPRVVDVNAELNKADDSLTKNDLTSARRILRTLHGLDNLSHDHRIRIAEGLTRARDFQGAVQAFQRIPTFRSGEEPYRFYYAISLYETGDYNSARRELMAALPHIETTPDVARYRAKIDAALN